MEEAAQQLAVCVNDDEFVSPQGHSKHQLWMRLCDMCSKYPKQVGGSLKVSTHTRAHARVHADTQSRTRAHWLRYFQQSEKGSEWVRMKNFVQWCCEKSFSSAVPPSLD